MTVSSTTRKAGPFFGNDVTVAFPFTFKIFEGADLEVTLVDTTGLATVLTLDSDYSIAINADQDNDPGGTITYPVTGVPLPTGATLTAIGDMAAEQGTDYQNLSRFLPTTVGNSFDKATILVQQLLERLSRAFVVPVNDVTAPSALPDAATRAGGFLAFDAGGQPIASSGTGADAGLRTDLAANGGSALVKYTAGGIGAVPRPLDAKLNNDLPVCVYDYGAIGGGSIDDTSAFEKALATGRPVYMMDPVGGHKLTDGLDIATTGQRLFGIGRRTSKIVIGPDFNMAAAAVLNYTGGEAGMDLDDLWIELAQPDSATRADYHQYPVVLKAQGQPRFGVRRVRINGAWDGIDMTGNSGGAGIESLELGSYNRGVDIDGALDSVRVKGLHWYIFTATANQLAVFQDPLNRGLRSGRCDDLQLSDSLFIGGQGVEFRATASGETLGRIVNTDFDSYNGILMSAGFITGSALLFTIVRDGHRAINMTGGQMTIAGAELTNSVELANPLVDFDVAGIVNASLILSGYRVRATGDTKLFYAHSASAQANLQLHGGRIERRQNVAETNPSVHGAAGSRVMVTGLENNDKGTGSGNWLQLDVDSGHVIRDIGANGWNVSLPATMTQLSIGDIAGLGSNIVSGRVVGNEAPPLYFTGNLVAGIKTFAHGIPALQQKVLDATAAYKGGSGEWIPMTLAYIDGTNISITGGVGTAAYRVAVRFTETQQGW